MSKQHCYNKMHHKCRMTSDASLKQPFHYRAIKNSSIGLLSFLLAFISFSTLSPIESTDAAEVLLANQATGGAVSLTTTGNINLTMQTDASGAVRTAVDAVRVASGNSGYQLYLSMQGSNNSLVRDGATATGTDTNTGLPTYADADIIPAGGGDAISSPSTLTNNTWGFAVPAANATSGSGSEDVVANGFDSSYPTGTNSVPTSKFAKVPVKGSDVRIARRVGATNNEGTLTNVYYGAKVTTSKPSGLYSNTITYTAIGDSNTTGLASVTPERTNQLAGGQTLDIATSSTLTLSSIASVSVTVGDQTCSNPTAYNSSGGSLVNVTCTSPALATGWHEVIINLNTTAGSTETYVVNPGIEYYSDATTVATTMQDFTLAQCNAMNTGQSAILSDTRDGKTYSIAKQADGNCWMTQNLRIGDPNRDITLTSADSDVSFDFTIHSSDVQTTTGIDWSTSADSTHIYSFAENSDISTDNKILYGNLYNWYTATASTGTTSITSGDAYGSICPKGWMLPPNEGDGSYYNLFQISNITDDSVGSNKLRSAPYYFTLNGHYDNDSPFNQGLIGPYWSRTSDSSSARGVDLRMNNVVIQNHYKKYGAAVRCVMVAAQPTYMQELTSAYCNNMTTAQTMTLTDARDSNTYSVTKQADGNCWMTQNLRLGTTSNSTSTQNVTLTSASSDVAPGSANFTISSSDILKTGDTYTDWSTSIETTHVYSFANTTNTTSYGNLYNWYTATAGTGLHSTGSTISGEEAPGSICPKGWKLPTNENNGTTPINGSYWNLMRNAVATDISSSGNNTTYTSRFTQNPLSFAPSGDYNNSRPNVQGIIGNYWSRTAHTADYARYFVYNTNGDFNFRVSGYGKYFGFAVRCVMVP